MRLSQMVTETEGIKRLQFKFEELVIDLKEIKNLLGYEEGHLPAPFCIYLEEALQEAGKSTDIRAVYRIINDINVTSSSIQVPSEQLEFKINKIIGKKLKGSERCAFFICTAGENISNKSKLLLNADNPVLSYIYDLLGSAVAEAVADKVQEEIKREAGLNGEMITNRYSPGYCYWDVSEQHKLFSLFSSTLGIALNNSSLMQPTKSISGVIGIGKNVVYRNNSCELCTHVNCKRRRLGGSFGH